MRVLLLTAQVCAAVLVLGQLSACTRDHREAEIKECIAKVEGAQGQPDPASSNETAEDRHDRTGAEVADCMSGLGYRHDDGAMTDQRCVNDVDYNPFCYVARR